MSTVKRYTVWANFGTAIYFAYLNFGGDFMLTVTVNGHTYMIKCDDHYRAELLVLAALVAIKDNLNS